MAELLMFFGIGFFVAALLGLLIVLYVHNRFGRLGSVDQSHTDVRQLEQKLAVALEERSKLQREIAAMKRDVELTWADERIESAIFRQRISDVAYEVVRITRALESPGSSIEPISAYATLGIGHGRRTQTPDIDSASSEATAPTMHTGLLGSAGERKAIPPAFNRPRVLRRWPLVVASSIWNIGSLEHSPRRGTPRLSLLNRSGRQFGRRLVWFNCWC